MNSDDPRDPFAVIDPYPTGIMGPLGPFRMALIKARVDFVRRDAARQLAEMREAAKDPAVAARLLKPL